MTEAKCGLSEYSEIETEKHSVLALMPFQDLELLKIQETQFQNSDGFRVCPKNFELPAQK